MLQRGLIGLAAAIVALALTGGSAFAFECYNASRSDEGNAGAANGQGATIADFLSGEVGLCDDGVAFVVEGLEEQGFQTDVVINTHTLMAGGLEKNGKGEEKLHDGQGIDHLSEEFFAAADALIGPAFGLCEE
jgi:hypothetical protein